MQDSYKILFSVIRSALTGTAVDPEPFRGLDVDYQALLKLSVKHQITPLVFQGLYTITGDFPGIEKYYDVTFSLMCHDQNQMRCLAQICRLFGDNGIDYMLLKGSSIKSLYPATEMRIMGDIDILIREEQYPKIQELLPQTGLHEEYESNHELVWKSDDGVMVELHKKLIPSYNDDYYTYYVNPWERAVLQEGSRYAMTAEDEYIYIFTHLTKHYRDGGIGLRHIIDIWYYRRCHPELDMAYVGSELDKLELHRFHDHIWDAICVWFEGAEETELSAYITQRILESGAYGLREKCEMATVARLTAQEDSAEAARRHKLLTLIFLPYDSMKQKYPILGKAPILLPVYWVVRWVQVLVCKRDRISGQVDSLKKINNENVDAYTRELEMVGLKFDLQKR